MRLFELLQETTTAGGVATISGQMGSMNKRGQSAMYGAKSKPKKKKKVSETDKYKNSLKKD